MMQEFICEILDSEFDIHRDEHLEKELNNHLDGKIHKSFTRVFHSDHMKNNGHSILRLMRPKHIVEYHFLTTGKFEDHKLDKKSMLHSMKIINDDATEQLKHHRKIHLQAHTDKQHENYKRLAEYIAKNHKDKVVKDIGTTERLDGSGYAKTHVIEGKYDNNRIPFSEFLENLR